jgi:FixJ family two-component response regulator
MEHMGDRMALSGDQRINFDQPSNESGGSDLRNGEATGSSPMVIVVDDDSRVRGSLDSLFRSVGYRTALYASAQDLLDAGFPDGSCCIVLDVRLPQISGLDMQARLAAMGKRVPIVFVTGHGDISMGVRAMKSGAVDFLPKPFRDQDMLDAVRTALTRDGERRARERTLDEVRERHARLTPREREVMALVTSGLMNKQVAGELGLSEITVKLHRGSLMRKMAVRSLADLVRLSELVGPYASDRGLDGALIGPGGGATQTKV